MFRLPSTATTPFCPSEITGTIAIPTNASRWQKIAKFAGPGLLVSVGYMDPGNWATAIEAGSRYGYTLLFVVVLSSFAAMVLQDLCARLGLATGKDLAVHSRERYHPSVARMLWIFAEISIIACDVAEVLGSALAFKLLLGVNLSTGVMLTAADTLIVLGLKGRGFRQIEAIILGLVLTIALCLFVELALLSPDWHAALVGAMPTWKTISTREPLYIAVGILGATVMPHNLYLHSSVVQTRVVAKHEVAQREAIGLARIDTVASLLAALTINASILILAASAFHNGPSGVVDIDNAYHLLEPVTGTAAAGMLFGLALLAAGQSSTFTGTIAGQVIMDGFLNLKIPCWQRRLITRALALCPALAGVMILGENSVGRLLVMSQVVLSMQLPFAMYPLIRITSCRQTMGVFVTSKVVKVLAWVLFSLITMANAWLVVQAFNTM